MNNITHGSHLVDEQTLSVGTAYADDVLGLINNSDDVLGLINMGSLTFLSPFSAPKKTIANSLFTILHMYIYSFLTINPNLEANSSSGVNQCCACIRIC